MEEKKNDKLSKQILQLDDKLTQENNRVKFFIEMEENTSKLNKSISRCLNLLSESMKGPEINIMFEEMHNSSNAYYKKISQSIESEVIQARQELSTLKKAQDELLKQKESKQ